MLRVNTAAADAGSAARRSVLSTAAWTRRFYIAVTLVMTAMVIVGFWPSYFGQLLTGVANKPTIVHVHGAVFTGWMVLLLAQVLLVATGRVRLHRRLGNVGIVYGALVLVLGLAVSFVLPVLHVRTGNWTLDEAAGFLLLPLVDMVLFAGFFGAAIAYRARPEVHKRLMLAATVVLVFPAVARMSDSWLVVLLTWLAPLVAAMAFDLFTRRRVHAVHVVSVMVLGGAFVRVFYLEAEWWLRIGRSLLTPLV